MSLLRSAITTSRVIQNRSLSVTAVKHHWNRDYLPGKYPSTPEQRVAAAKKYELIPDDYEPYANDGTGHGDYPKLPMISGDARDPFYPWDDPALKRNFRQPMNAWEQVISEDRANVSAKLRYSVKIQFLQLVGWLTFCATLFIYFENKKPFIPLGIKQLPSSGDTHFTFELEPPDDGKKKKK